MNYPARFSVQASDSEQDSGSSTPVLPVWEVVADIQQPVGLGARRVVSGLRAPPKAPEPPSRADAATEEVFSAPEHTAVLAPWEDAPQGQTCCGCCMTIRGGPVGICPDCCGPVHNNYRRNQCIKQHARRKIYACLQCVISKGEKA
jgi:hypothetical protein